MTINIYEQIERLLHYGVDTELISEWDIDVVRNKLLEVLEIDEFIPPDHLFDRVMDLQAVLSNILDWAAENNRLKDNTITYRDLLDTKVMGCFVPLPSEMNRRFYEIYKRVGAEDATSWYYHFSKSTDYIRTDRIAKNEQWLTPTSYGELEITINLSKPELDPKAIAATKNLKKSSYPSCLLCKENAGYAGRVDHPARQNHRIISMQLNNEQWFLQFSPYVYYNEHAICFSANHIPMKISKETFTRLLQFVEKFPHYFIGSNADLPIVGGSILSHEHFQGGFHDFPMAKAELDTEFIIPSFPNVRAGIVKWPMSVIRLQSVCIDEIVDTSAYILEQWIQYSDEEVDIYAFTGTTRHNTITPIARKRGDLYEMDLVLRNNRTSEEHPDGIYHPHQEVHAIKKENIGLIEVMGLAVLPGRLKEEMRLLSDCLLLQEDYKMVIQNEPTIVKHLSWAEKLKKNHPSITKENVETMLKAEIGKVFETILHHAGVFKRDEQGKKAFLKFIQQLKA